MAKTDWQMGDTVLPDDLNQIGQEINQNRDNLAAHTAATTGVHGATDAATPNRIVQRDAAGQFKVGTPTDANHAARKTDLDAHAAITNGAHGATSAATANRIVQRDANGRAKFAAPAASDDAARKAEVDAHAAITNGAHGSTRNPEANKIVQRDENGNFYVQEPVDAWHVVRKTDLDTHIYATTGIHGATHLGNANRLMIRDSAGRAKVGPPAEGDDIARKAEVDVVQSNLDSHAAATSVHGATSTATANRLVIRDSAGRAKFAAPAAADDAARKADVDGKVSKSGDELAGDIIFVNGKGIYGKDTSGNVRLLAALNPSNQVLLGDNNMPTNVRGTAVSINGNTAWHAGNLGPGRIITLYAPDAPAYVRDTSISNTIGFTAEGTQFDFRNLYYRVDSGVVAGRSVYLEAVVYAPNSYGDVILRTTSGTQFAKVSTAPNTGYARLRSGDIAGVFPAGQDFHIGAYASGDITNVYIGGVRLIIL